MHMRTTIIVTGIALHCIIASLWTEVPWGRYVRVAK